MRVHERAALATLAIVACVAAGKDASPAKSAAEIRPCSVSAYVIDDDPKGLNLRAEPNGKAKVLATLPRFTELEITGVQGGWLRVEKLSYEDVAKGETREDFPKVGWVSRRFLGTETRNYDDEQSSYFLYETPDEHGKQVADPKNGTMKIVDCDGDWAKIETPQGKSGWLSPLGQCSNFRTNCS